MKTKLLRRVRKNFRIIQNGLGKEIIQEKLLFWWTPLDYVENTNVWLNSSKAIDTLRYLIHSRYETYSKKYKERKLKKKNWIKTWYNDHS